MYEVKSINMIVGDPSKFAIESCISIAYERLGFRALGYFVLHIGGRCYGVREPNATMLAGAFGEVGRMLADRGKCVASFASEPNAGDIVDAIGNAIYAADPAAEEFFGMSIQEFTDYFNSIHCEWHRNCDEAFDDGSGVLHFDVGDRVRLIADKSTKENYNNRHDPETLKDVWLDADKFYEILEEWHTAFEAEWMANAKISESEDQS